MEKNSYVQTIFIFLFFVFSIACTHPKNDWQGTIEEVDGVTIVKNPKEPIYEYDVFNFKEELTIGEIEGREEYIFSDVRSIAVSEDEKIFVLDTKECHIKVFSEKGNYLKTIGKKGQGPGEMQIPMSVQITPQKEIMVNDSEKLQLLFFSLEGEFLRGVSTAKMRNFIGPKVDYKGNIITSYNIPGPTMKSVLIKLNSELDPIFPIHTLELFRLPVMNPFFPQFFWQITKDNNLLWGISTDYEINVMNSEGELIKRILKEYNPVEITEEDKEERLKYLFGDGPVPKGVNIKWPKHNWVFNDLCIDEYGNIFVGIFEKNQNRSEYCYDIFDCKGRYIAKIPLPIQPQVWKKNKLYAIEKDGEGYQFIKRYRVTSKI